MGNLTGKPLKEQIREQKRLIDRSIRQLEREKFNLDKNEKKLIIDIRNSAKKNQMKTVEIQAKDLVRLRNNSSKFTNLIAQLRAISLQITTMQSTHTMTQSMKNITSSMNKLNKTMNLPELNKIMAEFMKQNEMMNMKSDMISDTIDDTFDSVEDENETKNIVSQVLDELGIQMNENLSNVPDRQINNNNTTQQDNIQSNTNKQEEDSLEVRMAKLNNK